MTTAVLFAVGLLLTLGASELFTNAVEWAGWRMHLGSGATGSLLAAIGTALPETIVPIVALVGRQQASDDIAIGTVLGAPFLLLTLGTAITGVAVMTRRPRERELRLDPAQVRRDLSTFLVAFSILLLCLVLPHPVRITAAVGLLAIYATYVVSTLRGGLPAEQMPEPLHLTLRRSEPPHLLAIAVQLIGSVVLLVVGANLFVTAVRDTANAVHISPLLLSIVLIPVATELPETFNSVLWVRSRDDGLAFGNVAGGTAFQACILGAIGVAFTPWTAGGLGLICALVTFLCGATLLVSLRNGSARGSRLLVLALPWIAYAVVVGVAGSRLQ